MKGYEGVYEASNTGYIRSIRWRIPVVMKAHGKRKMNRGKVCCLQTNLHLEGVRRTVTIPHIILETFVGPRPPGMVACHYNGDVSDNSVGNLRWDTQKENMKDRDRHGNGPQGERNPNAKLTANQVLAIRAAIAAGSTMPAQAKKYGVSLMSVQFIKYRRTWRHLP